MYRGETGVQQQRIQTLLNNVKDFQIKPLALDNIDDEEFYNNKVIDTKLDILINHKNAAKCINNTRIVPNNIDEILSPDIPLHSPNLEGPVPCNELHKCGECGTGYRRKKALVQHIGSKHEGVKYVCNQCEYQATEQGSLKRHKQAMHEGVKYSCNQCEYQATQQAHLTTHRQAIHDGIRYSFDQCEYQATNQGSLKTHKEAKHEGITYSCNQCEYHATQRRSLKNHKRSRHSKLG